MNQPKFIVKDSKDGQFYFFEIAPNSEPIGTGETYPQKQTCFAGIASVQLNAPNAIIVDTTLKTYSKHAKPEYTQTPRFEIRDCYVPNTRPGLTVKNGKYLGDPADRKVRRYYYVLLAGNGEIIQRGQMHPEKAKAYGEIYSVKKNAPISIIVDSTATEYTKYAH